MGCEASVWRHVLMASSRFNFTGPQLSLLRRKKTVKKNLWKLMVWDIPFTKQTICELIERKKCKSTESFWKYISI